MDAFNEMTTPVSISFMCLYSENEIDGTSFVDLTESDIKSMVTKLGIVKKIQRLQLLVSCSQGVFNTCMCNLHVHVLPSLVFHTLEWFILFGHVVHGTPPHRSMEICVRG